MSRKNKKSLFYLSIKNLIVFLIIPVVIIYIISNTILVKFVYEDMINSNEVLLEQISTSINENINTAAMVTANIAHDKALDTLMFKWLKEEDWYLKYDMDDMIQQLISAHLNYSSIYEGIGFKLKDGSWYTYGSTNHLFEYLSNHKINESSNNKVTIENDYLNDDKLILRIKISNKLTVIDSVWMVISEDMLNLEKSLSSGNLKEIIILKKGIGDFNNNEIEVIDNRIYYYEKQALDNFPHEIIVLYEMTDMVDVLIKILLLFMTGMIIIVVSLFVYYRNYKKTILYPIKNTLDNIKYIRENGELKELFESSSIEELHALNHHLNGMIRDLKALMEDNKKIGDEKLEVEIKVLQSQITSHFIFNTLNSIRILALTHDDIEVAKTIKNFSGLLKNNFTKGNMHTLEKEVCNIENYCEIMKMRFGDKFNIRINLDEKIKELKILKLIIQPIIENSITHGFIYPEIYGNISMDITLIEEKINIIIIDNGIGISKEVIKELMQGKVGGIAIYNSNKRINLYYGEEYGISIESKQGEYTKTTVILPIIE